MKKHFLKILSQLLQGSFLPFGEVRWGVILLLLPAAAFAQQDNHLAQFDAIHMTLNPATTGMLYDNFTAHIHQRSQWRAITNKPYLTSLATYDMPLKKFGVGVSMLNNRAGQGNFNAFSFALSGAYEITEKDPTKPHHLTTGVQIGLINKSLDVTKLTFDNQYDGENFDPSISNQESFGPTSYFIPDVNYGVYYYRTDLESKYKPFAGISGQHLTLPKENFIGSRNRLPPKIVFHGGVKIKFNETFELKPSLLFMYQSKANELNIGAMGYYYLVQSDYYLMFGTYYRTRDAFIFHIGAMHKEYTLQMSYDLNVSKLSAYSNGRGGFEISMTYTQKKKEYIPSF